LFLQHVTYLFKDLLLVLEQLRVEAFLFDGMNELADELIVVVFVLFVLPHKSIIISHHANTNIHTLPSHPPHNIFMNRVSSHSEQSSLSSIRAIREKMEANRSRTKGVLSPFTMPLPEAAKGTFEAQV
jgi:hypothetical protein